MSSAMSNTTQRFSCTNATSFSDAINAYLRLIRFTELAGIYLILSPATWGVALAAQPGSLPDWKMMSIMVVTCFMYRSEGCIINDFLDRNLDRQVERTKGRPIASGEVGTIQALVYFFLTYTVSLSLLTQFNMYSAKLYLSAIVPIITYPLFKWFTYFPQAMLGLMYTWGLLLGYSSVTGYCDWLVLWPICASLIIWTFIYDTIYAFQDIKDDRKAGAKSTAMLFGDKAKPVLTGFAVVMMSGIVATGVMSGQTWPYYTAATLAGLHLAWQIGTVKLDTPSDCLAKFNANKWLGLIILGGITLGNLVK